MSTVETDLAGVVEDAAAHLYVWALKDIPQDLRDALAEAAGRETSVSGKRVLADSSRKHNPWARKIYEDALARGKDHPHALRILGRAWLRVIWRMWQDGSPYDPTRHGSLNRLLAAAG